MSGSRICTKLDDGRLGYGRETSKIGEGIRICAKLDGGRLGCSEEMIALSRRIVVRLK